MKCLPPPIADAGIVSNVFEMSAATIGLVTKLWSSQQHKELPIDYTRVYSVLCHVGNIIMACNLKKVLYVPCWMFVNFSAKFAHPIT